MGINLISMFVVVPVRKIVDLLAVVRSSECMLGYVLLYIYLQVIMEF